MRNKLKLLNLFLDSTDGNTGNNGGGTAEGAGESTKKEDKTLDDLEDTQTKSNTEETGEKTTEGEDKKEEQKDDIFNPDDIDFNSEEEINDIDTKPFQRLSEKGIDINGKNFKENVSLLAECGMTDPEQVMNFLEKIQEKQNQINKPKTSKEVKELLKKSLTEEEKNAYPGIKNMIRNVFGDDPETIAITNREILSKPEIIKLIYRIKQYYTGGKKVNVENTPPATKAKEDITAEQAMNMYMARKTEEFKKNKYISPAKEREILKEIEGKLSPAQLAEFKLYF